MIIRSYRPTDLDAVIDLIAAAAKQDRTRPLTPEAFERTWAGYAPTPDQVTYEESAVVTERSGALQGFAWWAVESAAEADGVKLRLEGWVAPIWRRRGVGTALLTAFDAYARENVRGVARLLGRGFADVPGLEALFRLKGFTLARTFYTMRGPLQGRVFTADIPAGVTLRAFSTGDLDQLVDADNAIFQDHWGAKFRSVERFRLQLIETIPHNPRLWVLAWANDKLVGECLCHAGVGEPPNEGNIAHLGVMREYRGRGLGRALLAAGMQRLADLGFDHATLAVDAENPHAVNLYRSLGMDVIRERLHFEKIINH
jgi:mycothiol synthase